MALIACVDVFVSSFELLQDVYTYHCSSNITISLINSYHFNMYLKCLFDCMLQLQLLSNCVERYRGDRYNGAVILDVEVNI